ncbi:MAG: hypothetical protein JWN73_3628 [Betaproteobacteria bacterium]|nr:hypothetical protein [Betaproteobacteria bacterium]
MRLLQGVIEAWERVAPAPLFSLAPQAEEPFSLDPPSYPPSSPAVPGKAGNPAHDAAAAPAGLASISPFPLPAAWPYGEVAGVPRAEVMERVHSVLAGGSALSVAEVHAAIEARFKVFDSVSAVAMAMRHGVVGGHYDYDGRSGHYRVTSAA